MQRGQRPSVFNDFPLTPFRVVTVTAVFVVVIVVVDDGNVAAVVVH